MPHALSKDNVRLYFEQAGSGTPIIFLHEYAADHTNWEPQMRYFARGHRVIALDLNLGGLKQGRLVAARLRHRQINFVRCDTATALPLRPATFGYVLLDAPCTGLGTLREHPEIRWRLQLGDFARIADLQARMLENAAALLAPDGALVYSVCSLAPEEGEAVINRFRARHPQFTVDAEHPRGTALAGLIDADGFMRTRPDRSPYDGFFAVRLKRHA